MARHEVVFQDFAELAARLGLDAEALTDAGTEETKTSAVEQVPAAPPAPNQPEDPDQVTSFTAFPETGGQVRPVAPSVPDGDPTGTVPAANEGELARLVAELAAASAALSAAARQDETARTAALEELQRYDALVAACSEAERAGERARSVLRDAEALRERAFGDAARSEAARVLDLARRAEACAAEVVGRHREQAEGLAARADVRRLLEERARQEAAERTRAESLARAARRAEAMSAARQSLQAGRLTEALAFVDRAARECAGEDAVSNEIEIAALRRTVGLRIASAKISAVEAAVRDARVAIPSRPAEAVARLEGLDAVGLDGLPLPLLAQRFGTWARACARWCEQRGLHAPLRYAPVPGRGAVFARERPDGPYVLVSAIGMDERWRAGDVVGGRHLRDARPLCVR
jgi:hypothetical protein